MQLPISPPRVDSSKGPHQVNRAGWPTKESRQGSTIFCVFSAHGKDDLRWPQMGPGGFFPTNPNLADILGRMDLDFERFHLLHLLDPKFLDVQVPRSQNS